MSAPLNRRLRHRVGIESLTITRDAHGGVVETWDSFAANVPAEIVPLSGREFVAGQAAQAGVAVRMTIRQIPGVLPAMRVTHAGLVYNIRAVLPDPTLVRHLTLMTEEGVNNG